MSPPIVGLPVLRFDWGFRLGDFDLILRLGDFDLDFLLLLDLGDEGGVEEGWRRRRGRRGGGGSSFEAISAFVVVT